LAAYRPALAEIVRPNIHPIMHLVSRFLLKFLNPIPKTLIVFLISPNHPIAVRIKIRLALNSSQSFEHEPAPNLVLKLAPKLRIIVSPAPYCQFFKRINNSKPKNLFLPKQQFFAKIAKFI
jgi:hypothetical protein